MGLGPSIIQASVIAGICFKIYEIPIELCFVLAFSLANVSPGVCIPIILGFHEKGYGKHKGIAPLVIASVAFDNIFCIIMFGVCKTIAFNLAYTRVGVDDPQEMGLTIGMLFVQNVVGIAAGKIMGLFSFFFKFIKNPTL